MLRNCFDFYRISFLVYFGFLQPSFSPVCNFAFSHIARYAPKNKAANEQKIRLNKRRIKIKTVSKIQAFYVSEPAWGFLYDLREY